jgi:mono/diheme cytochrome c family protein
MFGTRSQGLVRRFLCGLFLTVGCTAFAFAADTATPEAAGTIADVQRGRLLYETHCIACHTTQAHWRDKHVVRSWADLLYQVTRMQNNAGQEWSMTEITDVAAYLNDLFYKMPCPAAVCRDSQARADGRTTLARKR